MAAWREADAASSARHLAEAVAELQAAGRLDPAAGPALVPMLSGALNEAVLWAAEAEDREAAVAGSLDCCGSGSPRSAMRYPPAEALNSTSL